MITIAQALDAVVNAGDSQRELEALRQRVTHLEQERDAAVAKANREQANADFYFNLYLDMQREQANARKNVR